MNSFCIPDRQGVEKMTRVAVVGGCGHVGIPLGLAFASRGVDVTLLDLNPDAVSRINQKEIPYVECGAQELLDRCIGKNLNATTDPACLREADAVVFVTGTPVDEHLNPRIQDVLGVLGDYVPYLHDGQLIVLRSTLYPGTVRIVENMLLQNGKKAKLSFCPERILQGRGIEEIFSLPQLISGTTPEAETMARDLFAIIAPKTILLTPEEAELAKLMTNSWRYLEFAIANQFYAMAVSHGLDFYRIFHAMCEDYPRAKHFAKPGLAAGPCLFKDTMQLASFHENNFFLGHAAMLINEGMPTVLVRQLEDKIGNLAQKKVAILGMTFKADNDDIRESLSFKLKKVLMQKLAVVIASDPFLPDTVPLMRALDEADAVIVGTPHTIYKKLRVFTGICG